MQITRRHKGRTRTHVQADAPYAIQRREHHDTKVLRCNDEIRIPVAGPVAGSNVYTVVMDRSEAQLLVQDLLDLLRDNW